mgnify:CR=1 FL=1
MLAELSTSWGAVTGDQLTFRRDRPVQGVDRVISVLEEEVSLACTGPLRLLLDRTRAAGPAGITPGDLVAELARRLPGGPPRTTAAATRYVGQVLAAGLLLAVEPVDPQDPKAVRHLADWLDRHHRRDLADLLIAIDEQTSGFGAVAAGDRAAALGRLRDTWRSAYQAVGLPWYDAPVLAEDVALREPVRLGRRHGRAAADRLPRLAGLVELFDQYLPLRRLVRDRFVARYGVGGRCERAADFAPWTDDSWYWPAGVIDNEQRLQAALRAALTADGATLTGRPVVPVAADTGAADAHPDADSVGHALAVTGFVAQSFWWTAAATGTAVDVTGSTVAATAAASRGA